MSLHAIEEALDLAENLGAPVPHDVAVAVVTRAVGGRPLLSAVLDALDGELHCMAGLARWSLLDADVLRADLRERVATAERCSRAIRRAIGS